jgi:DNA invertase Pin-like site-specific DNA recombinase
LTPAQQEATIGFVLVDGYVRVSHVGGRAGERFISPSVQREQIQAWATMRGATVGEVFEELDESGARKDRPLLMQALARIESGQSNGLVVAKLDRFGRSLVDCLAAIERIRAAGGTFVSVRDGLDLDTDTGRLVLRIMLSMAEWELDRVRTNWRVANQRAIARGVYVGSIVPVGYRRGDDGRLTPDPATAPVIAEAFRHRAARDSFAAVAHWLTEQGLPTALGNQRWTDHAHPQLRGRHGHRRERDRARAVGRGLPAPGGRRGGYPDVSRRRPSRNSSTSRARRQPLPLLDAHSKSGRVPAPAIGRQRAALRPAGC